MISKIISEAVTTCKYKLSNGKHIPKARIFDFRSDTVTKPTQPMLKQALSRASYEDDVLSIDPSIKSLESHIARITGMDDAIFCTSGTLSNQLGLRCHLTGALESVLLDSRSHIYKYENGGISYHTQAHTIPISPIGNRTNGRYLTTEQIQNHLQLDPDEIHACRTKVVSLENTLNGAIFPLDEIKQISQLCREQGVILHLDGARLWNASVETGITVRDYSQLFDSVSLCLSKGVGAPVGSVLAGSHQTIRKARHFRKLLGGGWRQAGLLAELAYEALQFTFEQKNGDDYREKVGMVSLLKQDHLNARWFVDRLKKELPGIRVVNEVETNMVFINVRDIVPNRLTTVLEVVDAVDKVNERLLIGQTTDARLILPRYGYSFDKGDNDRRDESYVMRLVFHYQTPREACNLLIDLLTEACHSISTLPLKTTPLNRD